MKKLFSLLAALILAASSFCLLGQQPAQAVDFSSFTLPSSSILVAELDVKRRNPADAKLASDYGQKIDLNNANVRSFRDLRGFYPTLAAKIARNGPYEKVEDVLNIPGLSERLKSRLQANLDKFTVTQPSAAFNQEANRFNNGEY